MLKQIALLCAVVAVALGKPQEDQRQYQYVADARCPPDQRHFLLPHEWDCTLFYYCEYGYKREVPRSCAPGTEFSFELQVCVHPDLANCDLPNVPPEEQETEAPTTKQPVTTEEVPTTTVTTENVPTTTEEVTFTTEGQTEPQPTTTEEDYTEVATEEVPTTNRPPIEITTTTRRPRPTLPTLPPRPTFPSLPPFPTRPTTTTTTTEAATPEPTTAEPTTAEPTTAEPTTAEPTTAEPTTAEPTTAEPTTAQPTTAQPTTAQPTTAQPTTAQPTTAQPTTAQPTTPQPTTTTQQPTTPVEIEWLPNGCPADFDIHHLLPHETECELFYYCVFGEKVLSECSAGLYFNPVLQVCDWPENAGCEAAPRNKCQQECHVNHWAHKDCDKYWKCEGETPVVISCSEGLHFNEATGNCDFICNAGCVRETVQITRENGEKRIFVPRGASMESIFEAINSS